MGTEMQIFVRKLITRINSSQNVQTVCQTGRFYLFSRAAQPKLHLLAWWVHVHVPVRITEPRLPTLFRFGIKFTVYADALSEQLIMAKFPSHLHFSLISSDDFCRDTVLQWLLADYIVTLTSSDFPLAETRFCKNYFSGSRRLYIPLYRCHWISLLYRVRLMPLNFLYKSTNTVSGTLYFRWNVGVLLIWTLSLPLGVT